MSKCYRRCNCILHLKLSVHTMVLRSSKEAKQFFRYANEVFIKVKSDITNQRNDVA